MSNASLPPGASSPREHGRDGDGGGGHGRDGEHGRAADTTPARGEGGAAGPGTPAAPTASGAANSSTMALILHALTLLCCGNWIFGVAGIVFAIRAAHARDRGQPGRAEILTRYSWYCLGAAGVMLFVMLVLTFVVFTQSGSWIQGIVPVTNY